MAIILLGDPIAGIRGSVGTSTYSANTAGPYVRAWSRPSRAQSPYQRPARANLGAAASLWKALTDAQRDGWDDLALADPEPTYNSLGELLNLTGFQYFTRMQARMLAFGTPTYQTAPTGLDRVQPNAPDVDAVTITTADDGTLTVDWTRTFMAAVAWFVVFGTTQPGSISHYIPKRPPLLLWEYEPVETLTDNTVLAKRFGPVQSGQHVQFRFFLRRQNGIQSPVTTWIEEVS